MPFAHVGPMFTRERRMSLYSRYILPTLIEKTCSASTLRAPRDKVVPLATGRVLEIGAGGGLNLGHYDRSKVEAVIGLDVSAELLGSARAKADALGIAFEPVLAPAEEIPLPDDSVDTVLVTFTLCSVGDVGGALREMRRVLKPGGQLVFCEHGAAPERGVLRFQRALTPVWKHVSGNCHLDRNVVADIEAAGFSIGQTDEAYLDDAPRFIGYIRCGVAVKP